MGKTCDISKCLGKKGFKDNRSKQSAKKKKSAKKPR